MIYINTETGKQFEVSGKTVTFGNIGGKMLKKQMSPDEINVYISQKLKAGYIPCEMEKKEPGNIPEIIKLLIKKSRQFADDITGGYVPSDDNLQKAEAVLKEIKSENGIGDAIQKMNQIIALIPRKGNALMFYPQNTDKIPDMIEREYDLINAIRNNGSGNDIMGNISVKEVTPEKYRNMFSYDTYKMVKRIWDISNTEQDLVFSKHTAGIPTQLVFHGSRTENWWGIIKSGIRIKPANVVTTGSMFGRSAYFANKAEKSIRYTSISGSYWAHGTDAAAYLGICEIAYIPAFVDTWDSSYQYFDDKSFRKQYPGKTCLHAKAGRDLKNDEIMIYDTVYCRLVALAEIKK